MMPHFDGAEPPFADEASDGLRMETDSTGEVVRR